jgi:Tfp pilus assembly protein PilF
LRLSKGYFEQAVAKDPNYALAYVGLAEYYAVVSDYDAVPQSEATPKQKENAKRALALDDSLEEAHAVLALACDSDMEWSEAEKEYERAVALNPSSSRVHVLYGLHFGYVGQQEKSLEQLRRAVELEPLNLNALDNYAGAYFVSREYDRAIEETKKTMEVDPNYAKAHLTLALAYKQKGNYDVWLREWENFARLEGDATEMELVNAAKQGYARGGYREAAKRIAAVREEQAMRGYVDPAIVAVNFAEAGEKDKAFVWLEKGYQEKSSFMEQVAGTEAFDSLKGDPRWAALLKKMGLPQ